MYNPVKPFKRQILEAIERTWKTPYVSVHRGVYPLIERRFKQSGLHPAFPNYPEVDHTDGIGNKGFYHWKAGTHRVAVIDALAMNLNDLALVRAVPFKLSNHITVPVEDRRVLEVVEAIAKEARRWRIAVVGGENSFHNSADGMDISMTVSGFVRTPKRNRCKVGDVLIGLPSSGLHANGFTAVREVFGDDVRPEFLVPTRIYHKEVLRACESVHVNGMMHITGGAFAKLKDILSGADAVIEHRGAPRPHEIFFELRKSFGNRRMYTTFNCGVGFVLSVPKREAGDALTLLPGSVLIGGVVRGKGKVKIRSAFDGKIVTL